LANFNLAAGDTDARTNVRISSCEDYPSLDTRIGLPAPFVFRGLDKRLDGSGPTAEALSPGDPQLSGDLLRRQVPDVPKDQDLAIAIRQLMHPTAELRPLVQAFEKSSANPVGKATISARAGQLVDRGRAGLPGIRVREKGADDRL
jgi:hypothetical protein